MIFHNTTTHQFEATTGSDLAVVTYRIEGARLILTHTWVPPAFRGQGIAEKLGLAAFAFAREQGLEIVPECSYLATLLQRHPEFR